MVGLIKAGLDVSEPTGVETSSGLLRSLPTKEQTTTGVNIPSAHKSSVSESRMSFRLWWGRGVTPVSVKLYKTLIVAVDAGSRECG